MAKRKRTSPGKRQTRTRVHSQFGIMQLRRKQLAAVRFVAAAA